MRRSLLLVVVLVMYLLTLGTACDDGAGGPGSPTTTTSTIVMPDVVGHNAAVAVDELDKLGFTNVELGTVDGRAAVVLPQNWTVREQSAEPGDLLAPDAKIVLGCERNGDDHWPFG